MLREQAGTIYSEGRDYDNVCERDIRWREYSDEQETANSLLT